MFFGGGPAPGSSCGRATIPCHRLTGPPFFCVKRTSDSSVFQDPHPLERLSGSVERVTFHSEATGFCVLRVKVRGRRDPATIIGSAASVTPGEFVECQGNWVNDRTHGLQFKASRLAVVPPSTAEGIEKYLASGMVSGIGPHFARRLVQAFGAEVFDIIEQAPQRLRELAGIGPKRQERIVSAGPSRRRSARSWSSCSPTGSARPGRYASTRPTGTRPSCASPRVPTAWPWTSMASASRPPMRLPGSWALPRTCRCVPRRGCGTRCSSGRSRATAPPSGPTSPSWQWACSISPPIPSRRPWMRRSPERGWWRRGG